MLNIPRQTSKWGTIKGLLQNKAALINNSQRGKIREQFTTECRKIYTKKIQMQHHLYTNKRIVSSSASLPGLPQIVISECSNDDSLNGNEIEDFLLGFRSDNYLMINLLDNLSNQQCETLVPFLCHFFYENFFSDSIEQEEILYIIYLLLEKEIERLNTPSLQSFLTRGFLGKFLQEFANRYEIKSYIHNVLHELIHNLENSSLPPETLDLSQLLKKRGKKKSNEEQHGNCSVIELKPSPMQAQPISHRHYTVTTKTQGSRQNESSPHKKDLLAFTNISDIQLKINNQIDLPEEYYYSFSDKELRKLLNDEKDLKKKEIIIKHLKKISLKENKNLFSVDGLKEKILQKSENTSLDSQYMVNHKEIIALIKNFITTLFDNLNNEVIIPYSIKCICKMISCLIKKKFNSLPSSEVDNFISAFLFGKLILPILSNPDINELGCNAIISLYTRKICFNIHKILNNIVFYDLFEYDINDEFTIFNKFIYEKFNNVSELLVKMQKVNLPPKIAKLIDECWNENNVTVDNFKRLPYEINYDYFEENPNDFMHHKSICFKLEELLVCLKVVENHRDIFFRWEKNIEQNKNVTQQNDEENEINLNRRKFKESFETLIKLEKVLRERNDNEKTDEHNNELLIYYLIIRDTFKKDKPNLSATTELKLKFNQNQNIKNNNTILIDIKNAIKKALSDIEFNPHCDWMLNGCSTEQCFNFLFKMTSTEDKLNKAIKNKIPLSWYCVFIVNSLPLLTEDYKQNDYQKLYEEIKNEIKEDIVDYKSLNDFLTINIRNKLNCLKYKIDIINNSLDRLRETEINIRTLKFIETEGIHVCLTSCQERRDFISKYSLTDEKIQNHTDKRTLFLEPQKDCVHSKLNDDTLKKLPNNHFATIAEFARNLTNYQQIYEDISEGTNSASHVREIIEDYLKQVKISLNSSSMLNSVMTNVKNFAALSALKNDVKSNTYKVYNSSQIDFGRITVTNATRKTEEETEEQKFEKIEKKVLSLINSYILKVFCNKYFESEPCMKDNVFHDICVQYSWVDPVKHLGIPQITYNPDLFGVILSHIQLMDKARTPEEKIEQYSEAIKLITNLIAFTTGSETVGPEDIIPFIIYSIIMAKPKRLVWACNCIRLFSDENEMLSGMGYHLIQIESAIKFIKNINFEVLKMSQNEFMDNVSKYMAK